MNNTAEGKAAVDVAALLFQFIWVFLILWALEFGHEVLGKSYQSGMNLANKARRSGTNAAKNTRWGQAAQQFGSNRRAIAQLKGRETLRGIYQKNPGLSTALMGGPGGGKFASRFLDAEHRKHAAEQVANLKQGLTAGVAGSIADDVSGGEMKRALNSGRWKDGRSVTASDRAAVHKLQQEGYLDENYKAKGDAHLARAALGSIMDAEIATPENIQGLANMLGRDTEANALFTEDLQSEAGKHGYKNLQYAASTNGTIEQYQVKPPSSILNSGLAGVNKDALDPTMDMSLLNAIKQNYDEAVQSDGGTAGANAAAYVRKIAEQTKHIDKETIVKSIAAQLGYGNIDPTTKEATVNPEFTEFVDLRSAIKSQGAMAMPAKFATGGQSQAQPSPQPQPAPQLIVPHGPNTARTTGRVNFQGQVNTPPPPPNPPNNPPNP